MCMVPGNPFKISDRNAVHIHRYTGAYRQFVPPVCGRCKNFGFKTCLYQLLAKHGYRHGWAAVDQRRFISGTYL